MDKIIPIARLAVELSQVKRAVGYKEGHLENDSEHSFQLALVCWLVNQQYSLKLNEELILKFALVHDLVEVYAGDINAFSNNKEDLEVKKVNEEKAFKKLRKNYSKYTQMLEAIEKYETKKSAEAQFVFIIDKILVATNIYNNGNTYYKDNQITLAMWKKWLLNKVKIDTFDDRIKKIFIYLLNMAEKSFSKIFFNSK